MILNETILSQDRLALFGFGLFETLLITKEGPIFIDLHWQRMNKGADFLGLKLPPLNEWVKQVQDFIEQTSNAFPYALRVTLSGGSPLANIDSQLLFHKRLIPYTSAQYASGFRLHLLSFPLNEQSPLASLKSTNYMENILAKEEAIRVNADEGLWLNSKGYLAEGTMSNLFFLIDGTLFTPSLSSGCLPGTRRRLILDLAHSLDIPTYEGLYSLSDLLSSDEIFLTNALMGLMPVRQVDDYTFPIVPPDSKSGMRRLELAYMNLINNALQYSYKDSH